MKLILASSSPRRKQLLKENEFEFEITLPHPEAESHGELSLSPVELVAFLAFQKANDVAKRTPNGLVLAADTVAECDGQVLGKPKDRTHAEQMLKQMRGKIHFVHSGVCLWKRPGNRKSVQTDTTELEMEQLSDSQIDSYLDSGQWEGKAGAFGYQDGIDWVTIRRGSPTNVIGLPMELLARMLKMAWVND